MLESVFRIGDLHWRGDSFRAAPEPDPPKALIDALRRTHGRFALALAPADQRIVLARDKLGMNKLFFAIHETSGLLAANYLVDLVERGAPLEAVYSVPPGHVLDLDLAREAWRLQPYFEVAPDNAAVPLPALAADIRARIEYWFSSFARQFARRRLCVCLSGGLDSSLIAAFARRHFDEVTAYTYGYLGEGEGSDDARYGKEVAAALDLPFRFVPACREDILQALDDAILYGQDWRDFNVHCAIVNELLAQAIAADAKARGPSEPPLAMTGDLMNEYLADYTSFFYRGTEYYPLPRLSPGELRTPLIRGLDAGDREVGVFAHHGIELLQPYGMMAEEFLRIPGDLIDDPRCKQQLIRQVAGDLLPPFVFERAKVRAQVGNADEATGVLPVLAEEGIDAGWVKRRFCELLRVPDPALLGRFVRLGRYRFATEWPRRRDTVNGYYTG
jgi:asparagine synthetase B (glutamine-hydrolysing)